MGNESVEKINPTTLINGAELIQYDFKLE